MGGGPTRGLGTRLELTDPGRQDLLNLGASRCLPLMVQQQFHLVEFQGTNPMGDVTRGELVEIWQREVMGCTHDGRVPDRVRI